MMWLSAMLAVSMALHAGTRVVLHWRPPAKSGEAVAGYNVYRMDTASPAWVKINAKPVHSPTYMDKTVRPGESYTYVIRSVDAEGHESAPSSPWSVKIPKGSKQKVIEAKQAAP
ncbi:MAG TPA: fibronectin type III domain-containing protein [Acidobacteriaceae bacterium]|nr:fibronectin type III domain-containing protein [Acidobacteriaceae bacterium]